MKLIFLDQFRKAHLTGPDSQSLLNEMFGTALFCIMLTSNLGRLVIGYVADRFSKKLVMVATYFLLAFSVPLALHVQPPHTPYLFVFLFGLAMGADYMMIPLVTAEQFAAHSGARHVHHSSSRHLGSGLRPYPAAQLRERSATTIMPCGPRLRSRFGRRVDCSIAEGQHKERAVSSTEVTHHDVVHSPKVTGRAP
jgi:hypothetical protein